MKTIKVAFSQLIGFKYPLEIKMAVLDWMLKTGKDHDYQCGWTRDGINKSLFSYSANNYNNKYKLPNSERDWFFDAVFSRAVFAPENKSLKTWRKKESIYPNKYRMLKFLNGIPNCKQPFISSLINDIYKFNGMILKKELHHFDYPKRTEPKIISILLYTIGSGWRIEYQFSFKEFDYEPGWIKEYYQNKDESVWEFLKRGYDELCTVITNN